MSNWPRAVLFDFDGVIVNSEPLHFHAFQQVLRDENIELDEAEYYRELIGFDDRGGFQHMFAKHGIELTPQTFERVMSRKSAVMQDVIRKGAFSALPGAEQFVRGLRQHYPLAICSGALRAEIESMLEGISLRDCFEVIVAADDVKVGKPDPSGYLQTARLMSELTGQALTPADCLVIEDAPNVMRSVAGVGFKVLGVSTTHPIEELDAADWRVPSLHADVVREQIPELKIG